MLSIYLLGILTHDSKDRKNKKKIFFFGTFKYLAPGFAGPMVLESCRSLGSNNVYLLGRRIYYASPILPKTYISNQIN